MVPLKVHLYWQRSEDWRHSPPICSHLVTFVFEAQTSDTLEQWLTVLSKFTYTPQNIFIQVFFSYLLDWYPLAYLSFITRSTKCSCLATNILYNPLQSISPNLRISSVPLSSYATWRVLSSFTYWCWSHIHLHSLRSGEHLETPNTFLDDYLIEHYHS